MDLDLSAPVPERGCGKRSPGGAYLVLPVGPGGLPVEAFLIDVPQPLPEGIDLAPRGMQSILRGSTHHLLDWIGQDSYRTVPDFVEEVRRYGLSRRIQPSLTEMLTPASRLLTVHARAHIADCTPLGAWTMMCPHLILADHYYAMGETARGDLEAGKVHLHGTDPTCLGACWFDVEDGRTIEGDEPNLVMRAMPAFSYMAHRRPEGVTPTYTAAIFGSWPVSHIEIVRASDGSHERTQEAVRCKSLPVTLVDE